MEGSSSSYIEDVTMDNADNGVTVSYCERKKNPTSKGCTYDSYDYNRRKEVFSEDGEGGIDAGFDRFKELFLKARNHKMKKK